MKKIKVGIVNYLNTKPLLYGIEHSPVREMLELISDYPANVASMLMDDQIDLGLIPVVIIPQLSNAHIITNYCIGCDGPVASVAIFSDNPLTEVEEVLLDYQSRTSVSLARILLKEYWKVDPELTDTKHDFRSRIKGKTAGLLIGDRALQQRKVSRHIYDLGEAWKQLTGLPFVFAAWVSNKPLDKNFIAAFDAANQFGLKNIEKIAAETPCDYFDLNRYFTKYISYQFDEEKKKGLNEFLQYLSIAIT